MTRPIYLKQVLLGEGIPKICVPLTGKTQQEILAQCDKAVKAGADLLEWRVDLWEEIEKRAKIEEMLFALSGIRGETPLLFTIRTQREGGAIRISGESYEEMILIAAKSGKIDLVDVEALWETENKISLIQRLHEEKIPVIASSHDFEKTDQQEVLISRLQELERTGADILKLAVMPREKEDVENLMLAVRKVTEEMTEKPVVAMSMGELGAVSRISGENFGSCMTFGTVGEASAPGQFPIKILRSYLEALHRENTVDSARTIL